MNTDNTIREKQDHLVRDLTKRSILHGGKREPLQIIIGHTPEEAMAAAAELGAPMASPLESWFNQNGIEPLPPYSQDCIGYKQRLEQITQLLLDGQSGVYVVCDRKEKETSEQMIARYNWPAKFWFLTDELWVCENNQMLPMRNQNGPSHVRDI